jgi:hypothetical protein
MTPEQFCYWLQGYVEITDDLNSKPSQEEWDRIKDHLKLVFNKVTPNYYKKYDNTPIINPYPTITC